MRTADGYIINKCLNGDSAAFGLLVDKYRAGVYALAYSKLRDFRDAEDVAQEAFINAYQKLRSLKQFDCFHAWLYAITSNLCKDWIKKRSRRPDSEFIEDQDQEALEEPSMDSYREELVRESVHEALDSLPENYQQVLTLYYLGGMNSREIAEFLGTSPTAVRHRLTRARSQLREGMLTMMNTTFEEQRLPSSFTFRIVEAVKRIKIHPTPRVAGLPWGLSLATGVIITVLSLSPHVNLLQLTSASASSPPPAGAKVLKTGEISVDILKTSQMPFISAMQGDGNSVNSTLQSAFLMAPTAEGDTWAAKGDMPTPRFGCAGAANGKLYIISGTDDGGITLLPHVHEYDPAAGIWARKADILTPRCNLSSAVVNGKIYAIGGSNGGAADLSIVEQYDPIADKWTRKAGMNTGRCWLATCVLDGKIYAIAGSGANWLAISTVEVYDPATDKWTTLADMPTRRVGLAAVAVNGKIYAIGGRMVGESSIVEEYDPATDTWTRKADMPTARTWCCSAVVNGKIYTIGGLAVDRNCLSAVEEYDPTTDTWTKRTSMSNLRYLFSSAVVNDRIYVVGGSSTPYPDLNLVPTVEEYTPPGWPFSLSPLSPQGKLPTNWGEVKREDYGFMGE